MRGCAQFAEAIAAYKICVKLDPGNKDYPANLKEAQSRHANAKDPKV